LIKIGGHSTPQLLSCDPLTTGKNHLEGVDFVRLFVGISFDRRAPEPYYAPAMAEEKLPVSFDPVRFAKWGRHLEGSIPLSKMSRIAEQATELRGDVSVSIDCSMGEDRVRALRGHIKAIVPMQCQRCMDEVEIPVDSHFALGVVDSEVFAEKLPEEYEPLMIEEDEKLFLQELIEDELILALPIVAMHPKEECKAGHTTEDDANLVQQESRQESPFAILKDLKI